MNFIIDFALEMAVCQFSSRMCQRDADDATSTHSS
jgi:hypothetical protein